MIDSKLLLFSNLGRYWPVTRLCATVVILITFITYITPAELYGQIEGKVVNDSTKDGIPGAHIVLQRANIGTYTNSSGEFDLDWRTFPVTVTVSALGYKDRTITLNGKNSELLIELSSKVISGTPLYVSGDRIRSPGVKNVEGVAVSSLDKAEIESRVNKSAVDLLRGEPGVYVQQTTVGQGSIYIRGRAGRDVLYIMNGLRLNPSFVRGAHNQYFGAIDPFAIDRLSAFRGPVSVYYGSDALSGGVHVQTRTPAYKDTAQWQGSLTGQSNVGGNGELTFNGQLTRQTKDFTMSLNATGRDFSYYKMPGESQQGLWFPYENTLDNADYQFFAYDFNAKLRMNERATIRAHSYYGTIPDAPRFDRMTLGYGIEEDPGQSTPRLAYYSNTAPLVLSRHSIDYEYLLNEDWAERVIIRGGFSRLRDDRKSIEFADAPRYPDKNNYSESDTTLYDRNTSNQWLLAIDMISPLPNNVMLRWGFDVSTDEIESELYYRPEPDRAESLIPRYANGSTYLQGGTYVNGTIPFTEKFQAEAGVRHSFAYADLPMDNRGIPDYDKSFGQFTGSLALKYQLRESLSIVSHTGTGFRAPNVADLSQLGTRRSNEYQTPNSNLVPEKTLNVDLGIKYSNSWISGSVTGFRLHYFDKIKRVETGNIVNDQGEIIREGDNLKGNDEYKEVKASNVTSKTVWGVESSFDISPNRFLSAGGTFTYVYGTLERKNGTTRPADRIPAANGRAYLNINRWRDVQIRPQIKYALEKPASRLSPGEIDDTRTSRYGTDGFVNVQLLLKTTVLPQLEMKVMGDNLLNTSYRYHASTLDGMARNVTLTLKYSFKSMDEQL